MKTKEEEKQERLDKFYDFLIGHYSSQIEIMSKGMLVLIPLAIVTGIIIILAFIFNA